MSARSLLPLLVLSCSSAEAPAAAPQKTLVLGELTVETGDFDVPAGDSFECFYTTLKTDREVSVTRARAVQGNGGHHVTIYYADEVRPASHHKCDDAEMTAWHQVAAAAGSEGASAAFALPEGLAFKIPAGKQIVVQAHYINTTGKPYRANDRIAIELVDPKTVRAHANLLIAADLGFKIPAKGKYTHTTTCTVQYDLNIATMFGHMHELGAHYKLERIDEAGNSLEILYERDWEPQFTSHTPENRFTYDKPYAIKEGTRLRQSCTWDNTTGEEVGHPREMCLGLFFYFPDAGNKICFMSE
jgi:hypothetical protein